MSWDDLKYLQSSGHTIGAYSTPFKASGLQIQFLEAEIVRSADFIESKLGNSVEHFAYSLVVG